ncbi:MAG: glycoside hydrolase family 3 protein [Nocardioides sp.]
MVSSEAMDNLRTLAHAAVVTGFVGTTVPDRLARRVDAGLGGVCLFGQNVEDEGQVTALAADLHGRGRVLVMSDEEGGDVTRLEVRQGSSYPGHATLGALDDVEATHGVAAAMGRRLRAVGIDVALAPVVDVNADPENPVIGVRSFGATPDLVARHGAAFVRGLQGSGVAACAKHFPGHGSTHVDSHLALPTVDDPVEVLRERDIAPFAAVIEAGVRCIMTAHVVFPAYDDRPATLSPVLLELLRDDLGFDGVVITDALDMKAIADSVGHGEGAVRSIEAGADLICIGNPGFPENYDPDRQLGVVVDALVAAVESGRLPGERLERAAARVADLTAWLAKEPSGGASDPGDVAARAVTARGDVRVERPRILDLGGAVNIAAGDRDRHLRDRLERYAGDGRLVVLARYPSQLAEVADLVADDPTAVVVWAGIDVDVPGDNVVLTHGGGRAVADAAADLIVGAGR